MRTALAKVTEAEEPETAYEGGFMRSAENEDPCWSRLYPDFDALMADGRFDALAQEVWGRVVAWAVTHVTVSLHEAPMADAGSSTSESNPGGACRMSQPLNALSFPLWGSRLIEASAGTGKTWTIAALYLRLVLGHGGEDGFQRPLLPADILVMTFTRGGHP
jgi:hypothetical protein